MGLHESHPAIIKRLKRTSGHLTSVIKMLEDGRGCLEIAQQIHAVEKAIVSAKKTFVRDHVDHCLEHAVENNSKASKNSVAEFKEITKYL